MKILDLFLACSTDSLLHRRIVSPNGIGTKRFRGGRSVSKQTKQTAFLLLSLRVPYLGTNEYQLHAEQFEDSVRWFMWGLRIEFASRY
ncbi:hypothetical protein TNIN_87571 [Trichonephila inaurata madagascariensis]|uniref:Uncharacterized protein n=1 Tax=Trichonephila inaurata madagascariensis TaxID=2747483 RepID=A0A8X6YM29_9ARAC|nr:hypothetical protein TNIN_87571 [Trichonephila inaurata madagascariensis]